MSTARVIGSVGARLSAMALPGKPCRARVRSYGWLQRSRLPFAQRQIGFVGARPSAMALPGQPGRARVRSYGWLQRSRPPFAQRPIVL
ncbi:hypothetical protein CPBF424_28070 [Xanthomonas euroxanthea]|uniref:Uncharacterized protein n=1 Tax=Xanthomonas euroxanthea TaxID=2259622 RepID=A0AA46HB76_9XANT|nr:hypothetical protein CPBF424_28070 [Xanthomonas euroxanthea]